MKPSTTAAKLTIQREHAVHVQPRLLAEWEYNRFQIPTVTVSPAQTGDDEWLINYGFQDSIAQPNRPRTGIAKARSDAGVTPVAAYRSTAQQPRFYPSGGADLYHYWSSIQRSNLTKPQGSYNFVEPIVVTVMYPEAVAANKLVVGFETSYAKPVETALQITVDGTRWIAVSTDTAINSDGTYSLWLGANQWDVVPTYDQAMLIKGVRLQVFSMNKPYSHLDVLQLGARLENDLTPFLIDYSLDFEVSDRSFIAPMGKASSNTATVTLSNIDSRFDDHNEDSLYFGMIDKNVKFTLDLGIDATPQAGTKFEYIREFTMWTDGWGGKDSSNVSVALKDSSAALQEMDMPNVFFENMSIGEIIYTIMDRVGMANYQYRRATDDYGQVIPFYWPEQDATVWDSIADLSEATQTAVYFDEHDIMQIRARRDMYSDKQVDWNFDAIQNGQKLPDVETAEIGYDFETNQVDVVYKPAAYSDFQKGLPQMETVWEPEDDTILLRSSVMMNELPPTAGGDLWIKHDDSQVWPYESDVNISGEILHYKGKEYIYYEAGTQKRKVIFSLEEQQALDLLDLNLNWKNTYSGMFAITARGLYGSPAPGHQVQTSFFSDIISAIDNSYYYPWQGGGRSIQEGFWRISNVNDDWRTFHILKHQDALGNYPLQYYGTRMRFPSTASFGIGGMIFAGDWGDTGYIVELGDTASIDTSGRYQHELRFSVMPGNAPEINSYMGQPGFSISSNDPKGVQLDILKDVWYDVDITLQNTGSSVVISVYLNSVFAGSANFPPSMQPPSQGRFGMFVRGPAVCDFDMIYALVDDDTNNRIINPDNTGFLDLVRGGYASGFVQRNIKYNFTNINPSYSWPGGPIYFPELVTAAKSTYEEFGPQVHEIRSFDVQFKEESRPVGHSNLYATNTQVDVLYYESDAFGAKFMLANASRDNVIVHGEDTITYGTDNSVNQTLFVYGRSVYQENEKTLTKKDEASFRKRGAAKTEFDSRLIQTEEMANEIGQWIIDLWASGVDEVTLETFGNPFLQLGDLVTVNYPIKGMYPSTHKYFVVSISSDFGEGYKTTVVLRRANVG